MTLRQEKVAERIREEISVILHDELRDPRIGFVTVVRVQLTADLRFARIFYSVFGSPTEREQAREGLESALSYIRKLIGERIKLRYTPELRFVLDDSAEKQLRMSQLFDQIEQQRHEREERDNHAADDSTGD